MKHYFIYFCLIALLSYSNALPHFIYDGIESFHDCSGENSEIFFSIYGSFTDNKIDLKKMKVGDYLIEDMGIFSCSLQVNELPLNEKRKHKILCKIQGLFERKGYILNEPKVFGFDFNNEDGESSWPKIEERKTFLIGECGAKIEIDNEPLLFLSENTYENPLDTVQKNMVDKALASLPTRKSIDIDGMCSAMSKAKIKYSLSEAESAYLVYKWLGENIEYDCYALHHGGVDHSGLGTYNKGKGVCSGYSEIFVTMTKSLGVESVYVSGYSKGSSYTPGVVPTQTDHAWNSVKIGSSYYLVDSTWGTGFCEGDDFKKKYSDFYFCTNPDYFIGTHLPAENKWQLVSTIMSVQTFFSLIKLDNAFYENGFTDVSPNTCTFTSTSKFQVKLKYKSNLDLTVLYKLYLLQGNTYMQQSGTCLGVKGIGSNEGTCLTNNKGKYMLRLYGGPAGSQNYPQIVEYRIDSDKDADSPLFFPEIYGTYSNSYTQLIEPLYGPLKKGNFYSFSVSSTTYNNIYISMDKGHYQQLDDNYNGVFTGENVYIHGENVIITTLLNGKYQFLFKYNTINDPKIPDEPTFPQCYSAPKNVLFSPLIDTLKRGKSYVFKIEIDSVDDIIVVDGATFVHLDKDGSVFSKTVSIYGNTGTVQIASLNGQRYSIYYAYNVTS